MYIFKRHCDDEDDDYDDDHSIKSTPSAVFQSYTNPHKYVTP